MRVKKRKSYKQPGWTWGTKSKMVQTKPSRFKASPPWYWVSSVEKPDNTLDSLEKNPGLLAGNLLISTLDVSNFFLCNWSNTCTDRWCFSHTWNSIEGHAGNVFVGRVSQRKSIWAPTLWHSKDSAINGKSYLRGGHLVCDKTTTVPLQGIIEVN